MSAAAIPQAGLADRVHGAQRAFRAALDALSRPGLPQPVGESIDGLPLGPALAHLLLALTDEDTPVWWQVADAGLAHWLRFHTGARVSDVADAAAFAVVTDPVACPALSQFAAGTVASPEHAATLIVEVPSLDAGPALQWHGPGIAGTREVRIAGLPDRLWGEVQANHARFPQGVDLLFTCGPRVVGLPRTTRIRRLEGL